MLAVCACQREIAGQAQTTRRCDGREEGVLGAQDGKAMVLKRRDVGPCVSVPVSERTIPRLERLNHRRLHRTTFPLSGS